MHPIIKKSLPLLVLVILVGLALMVINNPPTTKRAKPSSAPQLNIEALTLKNQDLAITITSYGTVQPRTQSVLMPQVSGKITFINPGFRDGGFFEKDEVLMQLDQRDYIAEIKIAESTLLSAEQNLSEEKARVEQAKQDWQRLGNTDEAPDLVLRTPQLKAAQAQVFSAQATLVKAELALERSEIRAPYTGRVLTKNVDIGQVVAQGTELAEIYAVDYVEIRLPIKNSDLSYISLPENSRFANTNTDTLPTVTFTSDLAGAQQWQGQVMRTEGAFDQSSQQLFVVAQIDDPYGKSSDTALPLKIGQYVSANIAGKVIPNSLTIPNKAIYQGSYVYIVENNTLQRRPIKIAWQNEKISMISSGLSAEQLLVVTPLGQVSSGTPVAISIKDGVHSLVNNDHQKPNNKSLRKLPNKPVKSNSKQQNQPKDKDNKSGASL